MAQDQLKRKITKQENTYVKKSRSDDFESNYDIDDFAHVKCFDKLSPLICDGNVSFVDIYDNKSYKLLNPTFDTFKDVVQNKFAFDMRAHFVCPLAFDFDCKNCTETRCTKRVGLHEIQNLIENILKPFIMAYLNISENDEKLKNRLFRNTTHIGLHIYFPIHVSIILYDLLIDRLNISLENLAWHADKNMYLMPVYNSFKCEFSQYMEIGHDRVDFSFISNKYYDIPTVVLREIKPKHILLGVFEENGDNQNWSTLSNDSKLLAPELNLKKTNIVIRENEQHLNILRCPLLFNALSKGTNKLEEYLKNYKPTAIIAQQLQCEIDPDLDKIVCKIFTTISKNTYGSDNYLDSYHLFLSEPNGQYSYAFWTLLCTLFLIVKDSPLPFETVLVSFCDYIKNTAVINTQHYSIICHYTQRFKDNIPIIKNMKSIIHDEMSVLRYICRIVTLNAFKKLVILDHIHVIDAAVDYLRQKYKDVDDDDFITELLSYVVYHCKDAETNFSYVFYYTHHEVYDEKNTLLAYIRTKTQLPLKKCHWSWLLHISDNLLPANSGCNSLMNTTHGIFNSVTGCYEARIPYFIFKTTNASAFYYSIPNHHNTFALNIAIQQRKLVSNILTVIEQKIFEVLSSCIIFPGLLSFANIHIDNSSCNLFIKVALMTINFNPEQLDYLINYYHITNKHIDFAEKVLYDLPNIPINYENILCKCEATMEEVSQNDDLYQNNHEHEHEQISQLVYLIIILNQFYGDIIQLKINRDILNNVNQTDIYSFFPDFLEEEVECIYTFLVMFSFDFTVFSDFMINFSSILYSTLNERKVVTLLEGRFKGGKSTITKILAKIAGSNYFRQTNLLAEVSSNKPSPELITAVQSAITILNEVKSLSINLIKPITGDDPSHKRNLFKVEFQLVKPNTYMIGACNGLPKCKVDPSCIERFNFFKFNVEFSEYNYSPMLNALEQFVTKSYRPDKLNHDRLAIGFANICYMIYYQNKNSLGFLPFQRLKNENSNNLLRTFLKINDVNFQIFFKNGFDFHSKYMYNFHDLKNEVNSDEFVIEESAKKDFLSWIKHNFTISQGMIIGIGKTANSSVIEIELEHADNYLTLRDITIYLASEFDLKNTIEVNNILTTLIKKYESNYDKTRCLFNNLKIRAES